MRRSLLIAVTVASLTAPAPASASVVAFATIDRPAVAQRATIGQAAARLALRYLGTPYAWAGTTPAGFDCSGFTRFVYARFGIALPHSSYGQWEAGFYVRRSQLRAGDLVFFGLGHVGIWLGRGRFIHAPHTGTAVSVGSIRGGWFAGGYTGAVRIRGSQARPHTHHAGAPRRMRVPPAAVERTAV